MFEETYTFVSILILISPVDPVYRLSLQGVVGMASEPTVGSKDKILSCYPFGPGDKLDNSMVYPAGE